MPEEKLSDDLEKAAEESLEGHSVADLFCGSYEAWQMLEMFKSGSEWQRKKDKETIELAEEHAILAGKVQMKEEMMKDAVEGTVICYCDGTYCVESCCFDNNGHYKSGDKVKILIVKEKIC